MRLRQFRLLVAGELLEPQVDAVFARAGDACVEVLPAGSAAWSTESAGVPEAARAWDGPTVGLSPSAEGDLTGLPDGSGGGLGSSGGRSGGGVAWVAFDRKAPTLVDAIVSGVRDLDVAGIVAGAAVADDPLVTVETIAERVGRPVEVVRAWDLPVPVGPHPRRPVHAWPVVSAWLEGQRAHVPSLDDEVTLRAVTLALRLRALGPRLERMAPIRSLLYL